ncbi:uncharacterized protein LOC107791374 [Nicotiana tabacum]|uniref:HVA22-like protein n=1 Tax=Nicotiana tabacum TaxID=4097 RepID=A0A1S3ZX35_TOBAC|nr:PREDICTED: uncharacterized protein LOC107791374 [Nicotiana tabacum]
MGLVTLTLQCMDFLAWPILALGYPLYVSIRTIETGSNYDLKKLVTYWIIFSFIYLFEQVFENLIKWVPLWPYIRLVAIFWLVIPQFNGAFYIYQNIILPCSKVKLLDVNLYNVTEWFNELKKDSFIKKEKFLAVADRSFEENESERLAKLTASKPECNGDGLVLGEIEVMECTAKGDAAEPNQVGTMVEKLVQIEKKASLAIQVYEPTIPVSAELIKIPETPFVQKFQDKWTCAICQVTTSSVFTLQSHIRGRRHRAEAKLWCHFCNLRCSGEIDMIAHLKGRKHLAKIQETFAGANAGAS